MNLETNLLQLRGYDAFNVVDDVCGDVGQRPFDGFVGIAVLPVAVLELVIGQSVDFPIGIAQGEVELCGIGIIDQGEDFHRLQQAHFGHGFSAFNGFLDKFPYLLPEGVVAVKCGQLDGGCSGLGELEGLAADDDDSFCRIGAHRQEFGDGNVEGIGNVLQGGELGIALDAVDQVGLAGAYAVGHIGEPEAFPSAYLSEVFFYVYHNLRRLWCEGIKLFANQQ